MKKLLLLLSIIPMVGFGQSEWTPENNNFNEICKSHPLIIELKKKNYDAGDICECFSEKIISKYPTPIDFKDKFGSGTNFDEEAFVMNILPLLKKCMMMPDTNKIDIENTLNIWKDYIKHGFLIGCVNNKGFVENCISENKSKLECCKCALDETMIIYPDEDDYIDFMINADFFAISNFWENISKNCKKPEEIKIIYPDEDEAEPFIMVEQMPLFGDCEDEICTQTEIMKFVARNFKYPSIAKDNGVEGRVILEFVVEKDGTVGRVKILRGVHPNLYQNLNEKEEEELRKKLDLNKEELQIWIDNANNSLNMACIQVILNLPKFTPGTQIGKAVPVKYTVPIKCSLR